MRVSAHEALLTRDCKFYGCAREAEVGDLCSQHSQFKPLFEIGELGPDDGSVYMEKRCVAFIKMRGVWENTIQCQFPATRGDYCGRHDPASIDIRKVNSFNCNTPRAKMIAETAEALESTGEAEVILSRDIDARQIIYEAGKRLGITVKTRKIAVGQIRGYVSKIAA